MATRKPATATAETARKKSNDFFSAASTIGQRSHRPENFPGDAGLHHAVVLFRSSLGAFQAPAVETALGFCGFQLTALLDRGGVENYSPP